MVMAQVLGLKKKLLVTLTHLLRLHIHQHESPLDLPVLRRAVQEVIHSHGDRGREGGREGGREVGTEGSAQLDPGSDTIAVVLGSGGGACHLDEDAKGGRAGGREEGREEEGRSRWRRRSWTY